MEFFKVVCLMVLLGGGSLGLQGTAHIVPYTEMTASMCQVDGSYCGHNVKLYQNAAFYDSFTEVSIPRYQGMKETHCMYYCIRTGKCNAIIIANSVGYDYIDGYHVFTYEFDWCAAYKIQGKHVNVTGFFKDYQITDYPDVVSTWDNGIIPEDSQLIIIEFDACCPSQCPQGCQCQDTEDGNFLCTAGQIPSQWSEAGAKVYVPFEENTCFTDLIGEFEFVDRMENKALLLGGEASVETNMVNHGGCWMNVSSCQSLGFGVAFWIKVLSNNGFQNHEESVGVISALSGWNKEGWNIMIINWNSGNFLKFHVSDWQNPGKTAFKELDQSISFNECLHYVAFYQYKANNDDANVLFESYKNGQIQFDGRGHYVNNSFSQDSVNKMAFGRRYLDYKVGPYAHIALDELIIMDGSFGNTTLEYFRDRWAATNQNV